MGRTPLAARLRSSWARSPAAGRRRLSSTARIMAQAGGAAPPAPPAAAAPHTAGVSHRVQSTQPPCVVATKKLMAQKGAEGTLSLAQGAGRPGA